MFWHTKQEHGIFNPTRFLYVILKLFAVIKRFQKYLEYITYDSHSNFAVTVFIIIWLFYSKFKIQRALQKKISKRFNVFHGHYGAWASNVLLICYLRYNIERNSERFRWCFISLVSGIRGVGAIRKQEIVMPILMQLNFIIGRYNPGDSVLCAGRGKEWFLLTDRDVIVGTCHIKSGQWASM